jgi:pSer/pThr/pTyr-binding forkhead associated (FHA) protein
MALELILEEVREGGERFEIARLDGADYLIGREPDYGVTLDRNSISRNHGRFTRVRSHWIYQDLGSTNGSWMNGTPLRANTPTIIRTGDYVQLADTALFISSMMHTTQGYSGSSRSVLVFDEKGELIEEYPVPDYGKALVIGGSQCDLEIAGDIADTPSLVIERRGDEIVAYNVSRIRELKLNGRTISETERLGDRDVLEVAAYKVLFHDPSEHSNQVIDQHGNIRISGVSDWGNDAKPDLIPPVQDFQGMLEDKRTSGVLTHFGKSAESQHFETETMSIDPDEFAGARDRHPGSRYRGEEELYSVTTTEDKIILFVGVILVLVLFAVALWWFL